MKDEYNDSVHNLIAKHLSGETSSSEEDYLTRWRSESETNEALFRELSRTHEITSSPPAQPKMRIDIDEEWTRFVQSTADREKTVQMPMRNVTGWLRIAAGIALIAVFGILMRTLLTQNDIVVTAMDETKELELPDGTVISLNRNSTMSYSEDYGQDNRNVLLNGEAFFEVVTNSALPFKANAGNTVVQVLGTSFNISARNDTETVEVVVETGRVQFSDSKELTKIELSAGEKGIFEKSTGNLKQEENSDENYMAWKTGEIVFNETDLETVVATLNRLFGNRITIATELPATCQVTVVFNQQDLPSILKVLQSTLNLTYNETNDAIEIVDAECQ